jgi:hypothetical protein
MYASGNLDQRGAHRATGPAEDPTAPVAGSHRASLGRSWFQESLDTLILGALSTSLGVVLVLVPLLKLLGSSVRIDMPLSTYLALVPIGTALGVIGIVRARLQNRFTSPLSTLGALLSFAPASPQILRSLAIYVLIISPFAISYYGSAALQNLRLWLREEDDRGVHDDE